MTAPTVVSATPAGATTGPGPRMRASDADRMAVVARLHDAVGRGLLTLDEGDDRVGAALAARYVDELPALTADLPAPAPVAVAPGWRAVAGTVALQARVWLLGAPTWGQAAIARRRAVAAAAVLLAVLLVVVLTAAAVAGAGHGVPDGGPHPYRWPD